MINKKILSIIIVVVVIAAGIGTYEVLKDKGYINPGITINSFTSSSNGMMNNSSLMTMPLFKAHVDSSKTAEYEVVYNGGILFSGPVTGKQTIEFPSTITQYIDLSNVLSAPGFHTITFKVVYNSFSTSKTIKIYTFPYISFSIPHTYLRQYVSYLDTGISENITASKYIDNLTFYALGHTYTGKSISVTPATAGNFTVNYSLSYGSYRLSSIVAYMDVFNPPKAISISYSNLSYNSSGFFGPCTAFNVTMVSSGGNMHNYSELTYCVYVNGSLYKTIYYSSSHSVSCSLSVNGSGPFNVYFVVKDNYYSATSNTIKVDS